ncbi:MAG: glycosyltransferase family 4 protein [Fidelibacterota bacterium]
MNNPEPHICHITVGHNPLDDRIFYKECSSLAKKFTKVSLIAPDRMSVNSKNGVKFHLFKEGRFFKNLNRAYRLARDINADIYHLHEFELLPYFIWLKFRYNKIVIYDAHETIYHYFMEFTRRPKYYIWPIAFAAQAIEWIGSAFVDRVITVTPWVAEGFRPFSRKVELIYNFPLLSHFDTDIVEKSKEPLILYPGQISTARNIDIMVESMRYVKEKFPSAKLILLGNAADWFAETLKQIIDKYDLENHVILKSAIPYSEVPKIMKSAHMGLASMAINESFKRSIQIKPFEYMYCKIPVIAAKVPSTEIFVKKNRAGILLDPVTPKTIANAIIQLLNNPKSAEEMGKNGHQAVKQKYNWKMMETKLFGIYDEVLDS